MNVNTNAIGQSSVSNGNYDDPYKIEPPYQRWPQTTANQNLEPFPFYGEPSSGTKANVQRNATTSLNFPDSMRQLNQAIQAPGPSNQLQIDHSQLIRGNAVSSTNASDTQDEENKANQSQQQEEAQQKNQGQKIQQDQEKESQTQSSEKQKATAQNQDQSRPNMMNGGQEQSPGQQLNREVQETRQEIQNSPQNTNGNTNPAKNDGNLASRTNGSPSKIPTGEDGEISHPENVFAQVGQKAHMADQQHRQGKQQGLMGLMQQLKGAALQKAGEIQLKVGMALSVVGMVIAAVGQSLESNPFTAIIGAALVVVGNALKAAGMALKSSGMTQKMKGEQESKAGKTTEKNGEKMTQKATKNVEEGHTLLGNLRTRKAEQEQQLELIKPDSQEFQKNTDSHTEKGILPSYTNQNNPKFPDPWGMSQSPDNHAHPLTAWTSTA